MSLIKNTFFTILLITSGWLLAAASPSPTLAQGSCGCLWNGFECDLVPSQNHCDPGYTPSCYDSQSENDCSFFDCLCRPVAPTPTPIPGCTNSCGPQAGNQCDDPADDDHCVEYIPNPSQPNVCQCVAAEHSLQCGQTCRYDFECPIPCGRCFGTPRVCRNEWGGTSPGPSATPTPPSQSVFDPCNHLCCDYAGATCTRQQPACTNCRVCTTRGDSWTSLGCIPTSVPRGFGIWLLGRSIAVGGGIAFLLMIYAAFLIMTSQANPQKLQAGKELMTAAVIGLLMLIFSIFIIRFVIGTTLGLPVIG